MIFRATLHFNTVLRASNNQEKFINSTFSDNETLKHCPSPEPFYP